jgi:transcriptional regulator with XRE-family HTH domain
VRITDEMGDGAVLAEVGRRLARARLERNLTQEALATEAGVSLRTVKYLEDGHAPTATTLIRVLRALDLLHALDGLLPDGAPSPLELAGRGGRERRRATGRRPDDGAPAGPWRWGDER